MEYRVLIKEGYHTMSFVYDNLEEATKFAESAKTHRVFSNDEDHDYSVGLWFEVPGEYPKE